MWPLIAGIAKPITLSHRVRSGGWESLISANGGLPAHRYTPQVTPRWPRGSEPASPACVWSVYRQVAAAAAVLLVRSRLGRLMVGLVCVGSVALLPVVVPPNVVYAAGMSVWALVSGVVVCPSVVLCSLLPLVGRVCIGSVAVFCCVRGYGRRWAWRTTVLPTRWAPFPFRPVHALLVRRWPACVWSVYRQVVAAAVLWLSRGCRGCLMVGWVRVGSVALLLVVLSPNPARLASTFVSASVCCVLVCTIVV